MVVAWRCFYWIVEQRAVISLARLLIAAMSSVAGRRRADGLVAAFERRWVRSGWPYQSPGWVNLHLARFLATVRHPSSVTRRRAARPGPHAAERRLKVGVIGAFSGLLGFPQTLFAAFPPEHDLAVFDLEYGRAFATYLAALPITYAQVTAGDPAAIAATVERIHRSDLDVLVVALSKAPAYDLLDRLDVPCIAHWTGSSEPLYHANVDFELFPQPQADYFIVDGRLFCTLTRAPFSQRRFFEVDAHYDLRDLKGTQVPGFRDREPLVTFHGSLYKLAQPDFLDVLLRMLVDEPGAQLVFMGRDNGVALESIRRAASRHGIAGRVHYEGAFSAVRGATGSVADSGWARMKSLLARARLAANPWPLGGGSARIEAYAAGVPCPGIRLSFDERDWNRPQLVVCDLPGFHVPAGTARTRDEYVDLCRQSLHDESFFERVVAQQREALPRLTEPGRWWKQVIDAYVEWRGCAADTAC